MSGPTNMSVNPRRTPVTRSSTAAANGLTLKTNLVLRKGATFHSPSTPSSEALPFRPPPLPRRSQTSLDDVVDAHRRRAALTLSDIDKSLAGISGSSTSSLKSFRDESLPVPRGVLVHTVTMAKDVDTERRVLRPRQNTRRPARYHESDSGLGTSIATSNEKRGSDKKERTTSIKSSAVTRSAAAEAETLSGLSPRATNRIYEHTLKPLLSRPSLKDFHPLLLECPQKIHRKEIVCLRDLERTLMLIAPERTNVAELYLEFCITSIRCIQATVEYLSEREQIRPNDLPYTNGYFIDLVDQIHHYAQQLADEQAKNMEKDSKMDLSSPDEIKLHGGISVNGRPAELVRIKDGQAISLATGEVVDIEEHDKGSVRFKRSASQELEDEEEIMRSMARRKKNAPPEEYAPKKCREPGCNKEFKRPCDLTKHEKTHSRPWKCPITNCKYHDYGWPTEKERDRHLNDKHSSNPAMYECHFKPCPYKSKRESNCKQHMEKAHNWQYVRTKTNGKVRAGSASTSLPTPQLQNIPTPISDASGVHTPPQDPFMPMYTNIDFPTYLPEDPFNPLSLPQDIQLDYSPMDNSTPSTESSLDHTSAFDMGGDFTLYEDIYAAHAQLPTPASAVYNKPMMHDFAAFSAAEFCQPQPAPHISPTGQGNAMLFTPASMADMDEGFDEFPATTGGGGDFILFPTADLSKTATYEGLFDEIPSLAAGYSQPTSQTLLTMDWQTDYNNFPQHH